LASTGRLDEAIAAFERAVALDQSNTSARANLARALALKR
jgi:Flp pilus assembly protein TadD